MAAPRQELARVLAWEKRAHLWLKPGNGDIIVNWTDFRETEGITIAIGSTLDECLEKAFKEITEAFDVRGRDEVIHAIGEDEVREKEKKIGHKLTGSILDDGYITIQKVEVAG